MMSSWRFLPACMHEDQLVDAGLLVAREVLADLVGRADRAAEAGGVAGGDLGAEPLLFERLGRGLGGVAELVAPLVVLVPHVGLAGLVLAEHVVVGERVAEEVAALEAARDRLVLVVVHIIGVTHATCGLTAWPTGTHVLGERRLVVADPVHRPPRGR